MKIAIVHDYLNQRGGAERVVGVLHEMFPQAPIYTLFVDRRKLWPSLEGATFIPSFLQRYRLVIKHFKLFFWLYPLAIRTIRLAHYDVVLTSSSAYAKGVRIVGSEDRRPVHICYCHTPMRFAWDFDGYIANETKNQVLVSLARLLVPMLKLWDVWSARKVDYFIANSTAVQERIARYYGRECGVIHPPVEARQSTVLPVDTRDYFLVVSRLVSYKRIDLAVEACTRLGKPLIVIGQGPDRQRLESLAGPTVTFLGWRSDEEVEQYLVACNAFIFPGEEDFGIAPVEANMLGKPVVAYQSGGALDTVSDGVNGVFFAEQTTESLVRAIERAQTIQWDPERIQNAAEKFSRRVFEDKIRRAVQDAVSAPMATVTTEVNFGNGEGVSQ
ncbi:glycosyltransferase [Alicyclobacillus fastidiosus]|uniref:Glycosyltransferase n=1 Tax=Alicyclobacillus fastidiosus TaxID=392011 RepID=A0ABV5AAC6_9BACL|nr:glycosyltransferase [Alicyclobacillus fastidiosus]WEH07635.1 glycosyltransferase [Alicyclobacillus fastidiosus]